LTSNLNEKSVKISESHEQMLSGCSLTVDSLEFVLEYFEFDCVFSVGLGLFAMSVLESDVVALKVITF